MGFRSLSSLARVPWHSLKRGQNTRGFFREPEFLCKAALSPHLWRAKSQMAVKVRGKGCFTYALKLLQNFPRSQETLWPRPSAWQPAQRTLSLTMVGILKLLGLVSMCGSISLPAPTLDLLFQFTWKLLRASSWPLKGHLLWQWPGHSQVGGCTRGKEAKGNHSWTSWERAHGRVLWAQPWGGEI